MKIIIGILMYIISNIIIRFLLELGIVFFVKVINLLFEYLDNLLDIHIEYLINKKNKIPSGLRNSLTIRVKYYIEKFIEILNNIENLNVLGRDVFSICLLNFLLICLIYYWFMGAEIFIYIFNFVKEIEYSKIPKYLMIILFIPIIKVVWNYIRVVIILKSRYDEIKNKFKMLIRIIDNNIEELTIYKINQEIEYMANEITDCIGFKFESGKLQKNYKTNRIFMNFNGTYKIKLECISDRIEEINRFIEGEFTNEIDNSSLFSRLNFNGFYIFKIKEKSILDYRLNEWYRKNNEYFKRNHNQIHKRIFTNVRIIKEQELVFLESYIKNSSELLKSYKKELIKYSINVLLLELRVKKYLVKIDIFINSGNIIGILKIIFITSLKEYFKILKKIIY